MLLSTLGIVWSTFTSSIKDSTFQAHFQNKKLKIEMLPACEMSWVTLITEFILCNCIYRLLCQQIGGNCNCIVMKGLLLKNLHAFGFKLIQNLQY